RSLVLEREGDLLWLESALAPARVLARMLGSDVMLEASREGDARYELHARVVRVELVPIPRIAVRIVESTRIQRRAYFRVSIVLTAQDARVVDPDGEEQPIKILLRDLSAGGVGALSTTDLTASSDMSPQIGSLLRLTLR